ncbi:MAG: hypothetical protein AABZ35_05845 [Gemmatimonadota bacterium]
MKRHAARSFLGLALLAIASHRPLAAQAWDSPTSRALVARAIARRAETLADTGLSDFSARAHGFVFFLGQIGEGLSEPPRLIKADQLELEVYWRAPNRSKQRIIGWRDRKDLPTDINYHRDHLGIVLNNFADRIRLGEGDEVRDVPHPLSGNGPELYEFALVDSLAVQLPDREIRVYELRVRPRDFRSPRIVGSVFLDVALGDLVRMTFNFTRSSYLDSQLEDISVVIENSLWGGRFWLPLRQEIEIRRRATWLDFPARGIIRGRFEIDRYRFNQGLADSLFRAGSEIVVAPPGVRDAFPWRDSLGEEIREIARPARLADFAAVRAEATAIAMGHALSGLRRTQLAGSAISDFVHVNRVEGLAVGVGGTLRARDEATELRLRAGAATATGLFTGAVTLAVRHGPYAWRIGATREVRDIGDMPVISRAMNSVLAQEAGADYGDYYLAGGGEASVTRAVTGRTALRLAVGYDRIDSLATSATWSRGAYRSNPGVAEGEWTYARLGLRRQSHSFATVSELSGRAEVEGGSGPQDYVRAFGELRWRMPAGSGWLLVRASGGAATRDLPPHRVLVLGGRGTLLGEPFRARSGKRAAWTAVEWQLPVNIPEIPLGSFAGTGRTLTVAPFLALGWVDGRIPGFPGTPSRGVEPSLGLGFGWLHDLVRVDVGYGVRSGRFAGALDVSRDFWDIL